MVTGRSEEISGRIRLGMVGGGNDAFIGGVHRIAARLDDKFELVAGALSSTPEKSRESGEALGLQRVYDDYKQMAIREAPSEVGDRSGFNRHAQPRPLCSGPRVLETRHPCHLRQAAYFYAERR